MGIEIKPPVKLRKSVYSGSTSRRRILEEGPLRKFLREWKPILPRKKLFEGQKTAIFPPTDRVLESMREEKRREWLAKGYSEALVEKALLLADRWVSEMAEAFAPPERMDIRQEIIRSSYPKALEVAEHWLEAMSK